MTKRCVQLNWNQYMSYLCNELNNATEGTVDYNLPALKLAEKYSHSSQNATLFNLASMAVNNHWFFKSISPTLKNPSPTFLKDIESNFDNLENLRQDFLETANAMFGNGFVWLMKEHGSGNLRILCTYNAGSPYPGAHHRRQAREMATQDLSNRMTQTSNYAGSFGNSSRYKELGSTNALKAEPILCLNLWQQAWLPDYGLTGKESYILCWWEKIDWEAVGQAAEDVTVRFASNYGSSAIGRVVGSSMNHSRY
jgi:superoxide dismutase, Fe-Mn family